MGEITDIVTLYIKDSDVLEEKADKISRDLEDNIKDIIAPGNVGYDTGHLHDTVMSNYDLTDKETAIVTGWYSADYGKYWYRWKDGTDFLHGGLEKTLEAYR